MTTWPVSVASWAGWGERFRGTVDEVALYNKALTAARVSTHYTAGGVVASGATTRAFRATATATAATKRKRTTRAKRQAALGPAQRRTFGRRGPGRPRLRALPPATAKKAKRL